jgi:hypothetical protein
MIGRKLLLPFEATVSSFSTMIEGIGSISMAVGQSFLTSSRFAANHNEYLYRSTNRGRRPTKRVSMIHSSQSKLFAAVAAVIVTLFNPAQPAADVGMTGRRQV